MAGPSAYHVKSNQIKSRLKSCLRCSNNVSPPVGESRAAAVGVTSDTWWWQQRRQDLPQRAKIKRFVGAWTTARHGREHAPHPSHDRPINVASCTCVFCVSSGDYALNRRGHCLPRAPTRNRDATTAVFFTPRSTKRQSTTTHQLDPTSGYRRTTSNEPRVCQVSSA